MRKAAAIVTIAICLMMTISVFAGIAVAKPNGTGKKPGIDFSGPHYTLNILAKKDNGKNGNADFSNWDRHTIFVPLEGDCNMTYQLGTEFAVLDGNGMDGLAEFQIPSGPEKDFSVYIVSLGKPGDGTDITYPDFWWTYDESTGAWYCELATFRIKGHGQNPDGPAKKPYWEEATEWFYMELYNYSLSPGDPGYIIWEGYIWNMPWDLFEETGYWWDMQGCDKHIQVRFYYE